jgi:competence protein ComEC
LFGWVPVFLAIGIGLYFSLRFEPALEVYFGAAAGAAVFTWLAWRSDADSAPVFWAIALIAAGFVIAGHRAHSLAKPVLGWRYYGPIEGRVVGMDRSASDALRLTLDQVDLGKISAARTPDRIRISLHGDAAGMRPEPGMRVATVGSVAPPSGPVEPGGFDFQRHAWFLRLGAVGYTRKPVIVMEDPDRTQLELQVFTFRMTLSDRVQSLLPGDIGGFAAALTTGDRSGMSRDALDALRASNLAHLLAISGLHMGLLAGFVFAALRISLALIPFIALRWPTKKIAAGIALIVAAGYLALSGGSVATERAFVMVAVVLCAVLVDRRAFSLRAVAMAAIIVLCLRPEALTGPGFQMSFAATTALVAVFGGLRDGNIELGPKWLRPVLGVVMSSAIAGAATAPFAAAHFNTVSHYGLIANLLSVPLMGVLVIPAAVLAMCLAPFGLEGVGLWIMGWGLRWILGVAHTVANLDGARGFVPGPGPWVLPLISVGFLFVILWQGRFRWAGLAPVLIAFFLWVQTERPAVLIADNGSLVGVMTDQGRALSKARGAGFVALNWLENDGDGTTQETAAARWDGTTNKIRHTQIGAVHLTHLIGKKAGQAVADCQSGQIYVLSIRPEDNPGPCTVFGPDELRDTGSIALFQDAEKLRIVTARDRTGTRLWNPSQPKWKRSSQKKSD